MVSTLSPPICKTANCKRELTYLEDSKCWRCLVCNPLTKTAPTVEPKTKYVDVRMTEERVREIVRDELENWHIQKPPVTKTDISKMTATEVVRSPDFTSSAGDEAVKEALGLVPNWRQRAKELGIPLFHRKKEDVLAEIAEKTKR